MGNYHSTRVTGFGGGLQLSIVVRPREVQSHSNGSEEFVFYLVDLVPNACLFVMKQSGANNEQTNQLTHFKHVR